MSADMQGPGAFSVTVPLMKVWRSETGEMWFEGIASSTSLDRQQERMTPNAIKKMGEHKGIDLLPSHSAGVLEELGTVEETWVDDSQFRVTGRLEKGNPAAQRLFQRVLDGRPYGLSVGGRVKKAYWAFDEAAGARVRHIDDVELDHVAVCRPEAAANPDTYLAVFAKAAEQVVTDAPQIEETDEEQQGDLLMRIGKAAVHAARHMWPFGKASAQEAEEEAEDQTIEQELGKVAELRREVDEALAELRKALDALQKSGDSAEADAQPEGGQTQTLPGQEVFASDGADPWRACL